MTDSDKMRIKPLDGKSDYALWRLRVEAACDAKGLTEAFSSEKKPAGSDTERLVAVRKQASGIIVSALGDHALRVVRSVVGNPAAMLEKLDARYDSKSTASKITKMSKLVSVRFSNPKAGIEKHIDAMAALLEQLKAMNAKMDDSLAVGILIASIDVPDLKPVVAAIKTLSDSVATWETVSERLIDEWRGLRKTSQPGESSAAATAS